ncbi:hypothetical protein LBMAG43_12060 [Methylococcaceae bacterium]|nr:hypothetical protein LBMAG43_12060 [Methylococcaceae bacterium]
MATAKTTSITLNGAYILAADARITDFKTALDNFVSKNPLLQVTTNDVVTDSPSLKAFKDGAELSKSLNISKPLTYFSSFDNKAASALTAISNIAVGSTTDAMADIGSPEVLATKLAAVPGTWSVISSVAYDPLATTLQTISLKSTNGSKLTITTAVKDNDNSSNSYEFLSSDKAVSVKTAETISNAAPVVPVVLDSKGKPKLVKVDTTIKLAYDDRTNSIIYTNLGGVGVLDDIKASLTQIKHAIFTTKREVLSAKVKYSNSLSYKDKDYQVDISSTKAVSSNSLTLSTSGTTNIVNISTYSILSKDFSISLTGKIQESWGANGITEVMTLKDVFLNTPEYSLKTASLISTNIYSNADYFTKSGLTNLDSYNLTDMTKMKEDALVGQPDAESPIPARVLPKILSGDNIITLKEAATVDGGTGKDVITGSAGNDSLMGGEGNDILMGENGNDTVDGGAGNDVITGSIGDDSLLGGDGSDTLTGGKGSDEFNFKTADFLVNKDDELVFNKSVDTITDFSRKDGDSINLNDLGSLEFPKTLAEARTANMPLFYINGNVYFDINPSPNIYTSTLIIKLTGNPKVNDVPIVGGAGNDKLIGYIDDDDLIGNAGSDTLMGENGNDTLTGGDGSDKLTGGKGSDEFNFKTADFLVNKDDELVYNKSVDTITDFSKKDGDSINLNDLGSLEFPKTLAEARTANMPLFYINGSIYFEGDLDPAIYTSTVIIKLTGNPKVNVDFSDFAS